MGEITDASKERSDVTLHNNDCWVASIYNVNASSKDGEKILYNSYSGTVTKIPSSLEEVTKNTLSPRKWIKGPLSPYLTNLVEGGFIVPQDRDELLLADELYRETYPSDHLQLILMPTENCNFRCVYCYENFEKGVMTEGTREGLKKFVKLKCREIKVLSV